jgi:hypothetical protein
MIMARNDADDPRAAAIVSDYGTVTKGEEYPSMQAAGGDRPVAASHNRAVLPLPSRVARGLAPHRNAIWWNVSALAITLGVGPLT